MASRAALPKEYKKRLVNTLVDDLAKTHPEKLYAEVPISSTTFEAGFRKVTYAALANAVNGLACWLNDTVGPAKNFETLLYQGPNDMSHALLVLAAVKAGFKVRCSTQSPRIALELQLSLMLRSRLGERFRFYSSPRDIAL